MRKVFLSLILSVLAFVGVTNAQVNPFSTSSGYLFSTNVDWTTIHYGLCRFTDGFSNIEYLSSADGFFGGSAAVDGVMYGTNDQKFFYKFDLNDGSIIQKKSTNHYWYDMAYDYTTSTMYCIQENGFGKIDLETGHSTSIRTYSSFYFWAIACTSGGTLYAIDMDGYLYQIVNKETGDVYCIGNTGLASQYLCCAAIDPNTDIMYFQYCTNSCDKLYSIDLETAHATFICDCDELSGLTFDFEYDAVNENEMNVNVYPNPAADYLTVNAENISHITVINTLGQVVSDMKAEGNEVRVDVSQLPAGNYFVKVRTEGKIRTRKIAVGR